MALRIAVVGGGIAGLTAALALSRKGFDCTVYERTPVLAEVGAGVQIAPNATVLLRRLGLAGRLAAVAVTPRGTEFRHWHSDEVLAATEMGEAYRREYGAPYHVLHRADLHDALLAALPPGTVRLGRECVGADPAGTLSFVDGTTASADLVVGADGIRSVVRAALVDDAPRFSGQTVYRALIPASRLPELAEDPVVRIWLGPNRHVVCYPVSAGRHVSVGARAPGDDWRTESWTAESSPAELVAEFDGWHPSLVDVLRAASRVNRLALYDRDPVSTWTRGRLVLIGDAAHPMLPFLAQGANQAIEDAVALARYLAEDGLDGLPRYQRARLARTTRIQAAARENAGLFGLSDGTARADRDARLAHWQRDNDWIYRHDVEA